MGMNERRERGRGGGKVNIEDGRRESRIRGLSYKEKISEMKAKSGNERRRIGRWRF